MFENVSDPGMPISCGGTWNASFTTGYQWWQNTPDSPILGPSMVDANTMVRYVKQSHVRYRATVPLGQLAMMPARRIMRATLDGPRNSIG
jgi:hypothetical protein